VTVSDVGGFGSTFFGTAEAAPHSAACDALIRQTIGGTLTVAQIGQVLADTATERGPVGSDTKWGAGVVNCARA